MTRSETDDDALRREMVATCRAMNASGINQGTAGNVSARNAEGFLITPSSLPYATMEPADIVQMYFDGSYDGARRPSSEWRFHRDILAARTDIACVLHCHSVYATTLAVHHRTIPSFHYMTGLFGGTTIRCAALCDLRHAGALGRSARGAGGRAPRACSPSTARSRSGASLAQGLANAIEVETLSRLYVQALAHR